MKLHFKNKKNHKYFITERTDIRNCFDNLYFNDLSMKQLKY